MNFFTGLVTGVLIVALCLGYLLIFKPEILSRTLKRLGLVKELQERLTAVLEKYKKNEAIYKKNEVIYKQSKESYKKTINTLNEKLNDKNKHCSQLEASLAQSELGRKKLALQLKESQSRAEDLAGRNSQLETEVRNLRSKTSTSPTAVKVQSPKENISTVTAQHTEPTVKYAKYPVGNSFRKLLNEPEACYYKIEFTSENSARYSFCGDVASAFANQDAILDSACIVNFENPDGNVIITITPGILLYTDNSWQIASKAVVSIR